MAHYDDFITLLEMNELHDAKSQEEWDRLVSEIKARRGGLLPVDYQVKVVGSGLEFEKQMQFTGQKKIEKVTDPAELKAELTGLQIMQEDLFMAMLAIQTAIGIRSAHMVVIAISQDDGFVVDVVVEKPDPENPGKLRQVNQRTKHQSHIQAVIACGKDCHRQLMLLHQNTGKLQSYVDRVNKLTEIRKAADRKIIEPGAN